MKEKKEKFLLLNNRKLRTIYNIEQICSQYILRRNLWTHSIYTTQNLLRITFPFNDLMLKTNRLKKDLFYKDRLLFGLDVPVANMSIRHVYYA